MFKKKINLFNHIQLGVSIEKYGWSLLVEKKDFPCSEKNVYKILIKKTTYT